MSYPTFPTEINFSEGASPEDVISQASHLKSIRCDVSWFDNEATKNKAVRTSPHYETRLGENLAYGFKKLKQVLFNVI